MSISEIVRSLKDPVSFGESVRLLLFAVGGFVLLRRASGPVNPGQLLVLALLLEFVIQPVSTLLHELGHALAVVRLGRRPARVVVGREPWLRVKAGKLDVRLGLLPNRGVRFSGICVFDAGGLPWRSRGCIALAGPLATLIELVVLIALAPVVWHFGWLAHGLVILTAASLVMSLLANLSTEPLERGETRAVVAQRDGWTARRAFALHRAGAAAPTAEPRDG